MNNQKNFGNPSNSSHDQQQMWNQTGQQQYPPPPFQDPTGYNNPPPVFNHQPPHVQNIHSSSNSTNSPFLPNKNQRGQQSNRGRGNQRRGGSGSGQFQFGNQMNTQYGNASHLQQNQGNFEQKKKNKNQNYNQNWPRGNGGRKRDDHQESIVEQTSFDDRQSSAQSYRNQYPERSYFRQQENPQNNALATKASQAPLPQNDSQPSTSSAQPEVVLSQEEIEFNDQFNKWEKEFDDWKKENVNHPDKEAYKKYELQFESVRAQLLQRRAEMQKKKQQQQLIANPPKTADQKKFESKWITEAPKKNATTPFASTLSAPPLPQGPESSFDEIVTFHGQEDFYVDTYEHQSDPYSQYSGNFIDPSYAEVQCSDDGERRGIPGLDLVLDQVTEPFNEPKIETVNLEPEPVLKEVPKEPPSLASFRPSNGRRSVFDIGQIINEPGRSTRPQRIMILIRGAPGSGKSYLANLIIEAENKMGNPKCISLKVDQPDLDKSDKNQEKLLFALRKTINEGIFRFIVIEIEGGKLLYFNKFVHVASRVAKHPFQCYAIEINQTRRVCLNYNRNNRSEQDIDEAIRDIANYHTPVEYLLDPTSLIMESKSFTSTAAAQPSTFREEKTDDLTTNLAKLLQDKNVMDLLQSQLINQPKPLMEVSIPPPVSFNERQNTSQSFRNQGSSSSSFMDPRAENENVQSFNRQNMNTGRSNFNSYGNQQPEKRMRFDNMPENENLGPSHSQRSATSGNRSFNLQGSHSNSGQDSYTSNSNRNESNFNNNPTFTSTSVSENFDSFDDRNMNLDDSMIELRCGKENFNSNFNMMQQKQEPAYEECPTFTPSKIIDHRHIHTPTLSEQLMEFKVFRVIDYKHRDTPNLRAFVRDVDTDKIIEKRKAVALRKKILEYLKSATRPEDTVSNPKYPKNWEVIPVERPPTRNKRKKVLTSKIIRIKKDIEQGWMRKGYEEKMDLEDISSEGSMNSDDEFELPKNSVVVTETEPIVECVTKPREILGTLPDFNHFDHKNFIDIYNILWNPSAKRPQRIMIILRGASGSGKSHLSSLIRKKESNMGRSGVRVASINNYYSPDDEDEAQMANTYRLQLVKFIEKTFKENFYDIIIVDDDNVELQPFYNQFHQMGTSKGFAVYTIELFQNLKRCEAQNTSKNIQEKDIKESIEKFEINPTPSSHILLDPTKLYEEFDCLINKSLHEEAESVEEKKSNEVMEVLEVKASPEPLQLVSVLKNNQQIETKSSIFTKINQLIEPPAKTPEFNWFNRDILSIEEILEEPGRLSRPDRIMIVLRGAPGSGKTFLAKLIERKEVAKSNRDHIKLLSIDDYFEPDAKAEMLDSLTEKVIKDLKIFAAMSDIKFIIVDSDCCLRKYYDEIYTIANEFNFTGFTIELNQDDDICLAFNHHNISKEEVLSKNEIMRNAAIPDEHTLLDPEYLYEESKAKPADELSGISDVESDEDSKAEASFGPLKKVLVESKWDDDADGQEVVIERLDGTRNKTFERLSMAAYLQTDEEWTMRPSTSGKKRVRWADIEEKKEQERMRDIGFIVGQTDWSRMTDTSDGKSALEKTKYIEPRKK